MKDIRPRQPIFCYSCLAIGLATGAKISNLPLALPWVVAVFIQRTHLLKVRPVVLAGAFCLAAGVSFLPNAILNTYFAGSYTGDPQDTGRMQLPNPIVGLVGNSLLLSIDNFRPPIWPTQVPINDVLPLALKDYLSRDFPRLGLYATALDQIQIEESAGLGVTVAVSVFLMIGLGWRKRVFSSKSQIKLNKKFLPVAIGAWIAMLVLIGKLGSESMARLLAPYYPLLLAAILIVVALEGNVIRLFICKLFAASALSISLLLIIINPARPLFPPEWFASIMAHISPSRVERLERVYQVYGTRYDAMKNIRTLLPEDGQSVGLIQTGDAPQSSLWRPYGSRQINDVFPEQTLDQLESEHIHLIIADDFAIKYQFGTTIEELTKKWSASVVAKIEINLRANGGSNLWYLIALPQTKG